MTHKKAPSNVAPYFLPSSCLHVVLGFQVLTLGEVKQIASASLRVPTHIKTGTHGSKKNRNGARREKKVWRKEVRKQRESCCSAPPAKQTHTHTHGTQTGPHVVFKHLHRDVRKTSHTILSRGITTRCQEVSENNQFLLQPPFVSEMRQATFGHFKSIVYSLNVVFAERPCARGAGWLIPLEGSEGATKRRGSGHTRSHLLDVYLQHKAQWPGRHADVLHFSTHLRRVCTCVANVLWCSPRFVFVGF